MSTSIITKPKIKRLYIDLETTGTDPKLHGIHQIGIIIEIDGEIKDMLSFDVKPFEGCLYNEEALKICGVTIEKIETYQPETEVYFELCNLMKYYVNQFDKTDKFLVIGYNVKFDIEFLHKMFIRNNDNFMFSILWGNHIDVESKASEVLERERYLFDDFKLGTIAEMINIQIEDTEKQLHDALYDIRLTREIFFKLIEIEKQKIIDEIISIKQAEKEFDNQVEIISNNEIQAAQKDIELENKNYQMGLPDPNKDISHLFKTESKTTGYVNVSPIIEPIINEEPKNLSISEGMNDILNSFLTDQTKNIPREPINKSNTDVPKSMIKVNSEDFVMSFGKHSGKTIEHVLRIEPSYIIWLEDNHIRGLFFSKEIMDKAIKAKNEKDSQKDYDNDYRFKRQTINKFKSSEFDDISNLSSMSCDDLPF